MISDKSSPLLNRLISIFKVNRLFHRVVTLQGDTAGSRGVCSLLLLWPSTHTQLLLRLMMESWCITAELWDGQQSQTERSSSYLLALLWRPCSPDRAVLEVGPPSSISSSIVDWRLETRTQTQLIHHFNCLLNFICLLREVIVTASH